jgi:phospholipase/carboxylesterase
MTEARLALAGLATVQVSVGTRPRLTVVILHGYAMSPTDLVPFAHSMGIPAEFYFPEAPVSAEPTGRAWWPINHEQRSSSLAAGPRDLYQARPAGASAARDRLRALVSHVQDRHPGLPLVLLGFSQGGMLACDAHLRDDVRAAGLILLSSSRISADEWESLAHRLRDVPVLVSHGETDADLAFKAGEALRDFCVRAGADVTWVPFGGGHEIPIAVWRHIRRFLSRWQ